MSRREVKGQSLGSRAKREQSREGQDLAWKWIEANDEGTGPYWMLGQTGGIVSLASRQI